MSSQSASKRLRSSAPEPLQVDVVNASQSAAGTSATAHNNSAGATLTNASGNNETEETDTQYYTAFLAEEAKRDEEEASRMEREAEKEVKEKLRSSYLRSLKYLQDKVTQAMTLAENMKAMVGK